MPEQDDQVAWPNDVNYCEDLLYRIQVSNYRDSPIECSISFQELEPCDLFYPRGGFKGVLHSKTTKTLIVLHKLRLGQSQGLEIDKLETNF